MSALKILDKENLSILVIGDIMLDHYIYGDCNRISPEAPVPVVEVSSENYTLGGAGNVVKNLKALGCTAGIISIVGEDTEAKLVFNELSDLNIETEGIVYDSTRCTTIKTRIIASKHQLIRLDREITQPISIDIEERLLSIVNHNINKYQMVLLSDYNKGLLTESLLREIFKICKVHGVKTVVDPKAVDFSKYRGAETIKPNKKEASIASGILINDYDSLKSACVKLQEITDCDNVIVTLSEGGIAFFTASELTIIPTQAINITDVTGAGDTVLASIGIALSSGNALYNACDFANHAAAVVVSKVGSATATIEEIFNKLKNN